jgi:nicotinamidase-related amidase
MIALLLMCPQNSFLEPKGSVYMGEKAEILKTRLIDYLNTFTGPKIFFREKHAESDEFFVNDKTHSIVNTFDYQTVDALKKYATRYFDKTRFSGLYNTGFDVYLKEERISAVTLLGVETHTSILFTAEELRNRGIEVTVIEPLTMARDDYMHLLGISMMTNFLGVKVSA